MGPDLEIRREKIYVQPGMSTAEVIKMYGLNSDQAYDARVEHLLCRALEFLRRETGQTLGDVSRRASPSLNQNVLVCRRYRP